ncbi:copper resistance CopC family protein [Amycolatopsis pithecellobii]|uniref:CopC domain-containing protein n=1 Tax=Amycolatopsis pithecellobii TaxID=664692 RepID=A0A6N7Z809_9PSEU|nr:copper resistance protein CopC [Amycolatopsis pithecellobii]MTD56346.1 hypothetical protein [Amycolatopsis pithecellobii]
MTLTRERPKARLGGRVLAMALVAAACWAALLSLASPVSGDIPQLRSSSPGVGSTIRPDDLVLTFDRPVNARLATVRLMDPYHREFDPGRPAHSGDRAETVMVPLPKQKYAGTYTVAWRVPAGSLAVASGTLTFDLASRSPVQEAPKLSGPGVLETVSYWFSQVAALAATVLLVGAAFFVAFVRPASAWSTRVRRLVTYGWVGTVGFTLASLLLFGPYAARLPVTDALRGPLPAGTFSSSTGANLLARLAILGFGGLVLAQFLTSEEPRNDRERLARSVTVLGCAAALAVTWTLCVPGAPDLLVAATVPLAAVLVLAGGLAFSLRRKGAGAMSAAAGAVLLAATAFPLLNGLPRDAAPQAAPARLDFGLAGQAGYGFLDVAVAPAKTGENTVHLTTLDTRDIATDGSTVTAVLNPPDHGTPVPVSLHRAGTGYQTGSVTIPRPGQWELALTVDSGGQRQDIYGVVDVRDAR